MSTICLTRVHKRYGRVRALDEVTTSLQPGITALLGPNGAGKTTFLRIAATVLGPDGGTVRLLGLDPTKPDERADIRRRLGYMPQDPGLYPRFTAFEFVDYVAILKELEARDERHREVRRVLEAVGLGDDAGRRVKAMSGGMRRRLALAQALLRHPELLLLDEPTAGLDPEQRLRFRQLVTADHARTVLLSTHQTEDVAAMCSRVLVLAGGEIRFDGSPAELAGVATGRVWAAEEESTRAVVSWRTGDGLVRMVGDPPSGVALVPPTVEDGYLLLLARTERPEAAA